MSHSFLLSINCVEPLIDAVNAAICFLSIEADLSRRERLHGNCFTFCFAWSSLRNSVLCHGYSIFRQSLSSLLLISDQACETRTPFVMVVIVVDARICFLAMTLSTFSYRCLCLPLIRRFLSLSLSFLYLNINHPLYMYLQCNHRREKYA